jgi:hypothetical protein
MNFAAIIISLFPLFLSKASAQQIYKWKDQKGQWHFSDSPTGQANAQPAGLAIGNSVIMGIMVKKCCTISRKSLRRPNVT